MTLPAGGPSVLIATAAAFLAGSLPTAWILVRLVRGEDIRHLYSGNPGASNVKRVLGWPGFLTVFAVDAAKGALPVMLALGTGWPLAWSSWLGVAAVAGHCWSPWLGWNGGKGVATAAGVFAVLAPAAAAIGLAAWWLTTRLTGFSSLGSLAGLVAAGVVVIGWGLTGSGWPFAAVAAIVAWRHKDSWRRLVEGREHVFIGKPSEPGGPAAS